MKYPAIHLWTDLTHVYVLVEIDGKWVEVIKEFRDSPFSHIVESGGIEAAIQRAVTPDDVPRCKACGETWTDFLSAKGPHSCAVNGSEGAK